MKRFVIVAVGALLLCGAAGVLLVGIPSESSLSIHSTPVYPHATAVQTADSLDFWPSHPSWSRAGSANLDGFPVLTRRGTALGSVEGGFMIFTTGNNPQQVFDFYDSRLLSIGWKLLHNGSVLSAPAADSGTPDTATTAENKRAYIYRSALDPPMFWSISGGPRVVLIEMAALQGGSRQVVVVIFPR